MFLIGLGRGVCFDNSYQYETVPVQLAFALSPFDHSLVSSLGQQFTA